MTRLALAAIVLACAALAGCRSSEAVVDPDAEFGHRFPTGAEGRETLAIVPPPAGDEYFVYPAIIQDVRLRPDEPGPDGAIALDVRIHGSLPDACIQLHDLTESRRGHLIDVRLYMRRPKGALCAQVVRPYRFYYTLASPLAPGAYVLTINGDQHPFEIVPPEPDDRTASR
jgi:hypothetical protein